MPDSNTKLLLHMNSDFSDSSDSNHTPTVVNGASIDTTIKKFGAGSGKFVRASTQHVYYPDSPDWDFGSGDFTIESWLRTTDYTLNQIITDQFTDAANTVSLQFDLNKMRFLFRSSGGSIILDSPTTGWVNDVQIHIAVVRFGNLLDMYRNGINVASTSVAFSGPTVAADLGIGGRAANGAAPFSGNLDEIRISKGIARWTTGFTPPTSEYNGAPPSGVQIFRRRIEGE